MNRSGSFHQRRRARRLMKTKPKGSTCKRTKIFFHILSYKNAAYIVRCSRHQWSQITSRVNLGVKCLNVNNIKRQISHACGSDRILESGSARQYIILPFSLKGKKPHVRAHSETADKTSLLLPTPLILHIGGKKIRGEEGEVGTFPSHGCCSPGNIKI